jgi:hypothetical protein
VLGAGGIGQATGVFSLAPEPTTGDWYDEPGTVEWTVTLVTGTTCTAAASVTPDENMGERLGLDADEWQGLLEAAQEVTAGIDVAEMDVDALVKRYRREGRAAQRLLDEGVPPEEQGPRESPDETRISAVTSEVWDQVRTTLRSRGLSVDALTMSGTNDCPPVELEP